ncbi:hypothetical protein BO79DRAFT_216090 [Aspergillus costaricaensis CBS 115574]|uniref:Uncharacterized protein n=1 Tax=Aspergillus costaricaensis CBS 115574 TaxID=1448317 RepID=A0ACD1IJE7_9EURO|nr:hypothetical protein BO79DRAFT_216090 [Aspergillus costaricaensis CBS 115574]RAK90515.1 hypothetical protein BO79DRAFT_216090 [Aspergillus costaricaensis CBS 115574]
MTPPLIGRGLWWCQWPVPSGTFYVVMLRAQRKCASGFSILYILFVLPSSGAVPAQNTTNGQLLVMGAGFGSTGDLFILAAILYCCIRCVQKRVSTSCVGAYVPQNIDEFEQALELVRRGPETFKDWLNAKFRLWGRDPSAAAADGGDGGGDAGAAGAAGTGGASAAAAAP